MKSRTRPFFRTLLPSSTFRPSKVYSFDLPFPLHHMSSGSQGDAVVPKFDMQTYTSVLTANEVKSLVEEYAISLDLNPYAMPWRHQNSSVADPPPTRVWAEDIRRQCENIIDIRPVHPAMLYEIGLTTIWKHVLLPACLNFSSSRCPEVSRRLSNAKMKGSLRRKRKPNRPRTKLLRKESEGDVFNCSGSGTHHSTSPLNTIIPDNVDLTTGGGGLTLEFVSRAEDDMDHNLNNMEDGTEVNSPLFEGSPEPQHTTHSNEDTHAHSDGDRLHHDEGDKQAHRHAFGSTGFVVSISSGGSSLHVFPKQNPSGDGAGGSLQDDMDLPAPFVPAWNLTTHSILNDAESCRDMMINLATLVNKLADDHKNLQQEHLGCAGKDANLVEKLAVVEKEKDDLLDKSRDYRCWVVGVKVERFEEDAEAILDAAADYDPECKATFMFAFDSLFTRAIHTWRNLLGLSDFLWEISKTCGQKVKDPP
ncbi:hypothetical protein Tco_0593868 [Tanacetum coccineum]